MNDLADKLAKKVTKLSVLAQHPKESIFIAREGSAHTSQEVGTPIVPKNKKNETEDEAHRVLLPIAGHSKACLETLVVGTAAVDRV